MKRNGKGERVNKGLEKKKSEGDSVSGRRIEKSHLSVSTFFLLFSI